MIWFLVSLVGLGFGAWRIIEARRARAVGFVRLTALDGWIHRGKWLSWRARQLTGVAFVGTSLVAALLSPHPWATGDFVLRPPAGWTDAKDALANKTLPEGMDVAGVTKLVKDGTVRMEPGAPTFPEVPMTTRRASVSDTAHLRLDPRALRLHIEDRRTTRGDRRIVLRSSFPIVTPKAHPPPSPSPHPSSPPAPARARYRLAPS